MENHHVSWVNQLQIAIFNSYVSSSEGIGRVQNQLANDETISMCPATMFECLVLKSREKSSSKWSSKYDQICCMSIWIVHTGLSENRAPRAPPQLMVHHHVPNQYTYIYIYSNIVGYISQLYPIQLPLHFHMSWLIPSWLMLDQLTN